MTEAIADNLTPEEKADAQRAQMENLLESGMMGKLISPKVQAAIHTSFNGAIVAFVLQYMARKDPQFAEHALAFFDTWILDVTTKAGTIAPTLFTAQNSGVFTEEAIQKLVTQYVDAHKTAAQNIVQQHAALLK